MDQQAHSDLNGTSGERDWEPKLSCWDADFVHSEGCLCLACTPSGDRVRIRTAYYNGVRWLSLISTRSDIQLRATPQFIGWSAIDDNTYDADASGENGEMVSDSAQGWGDTEAEAINDLFDQLEDEAEPNL